MSSDISIRHDLRPGDLGRIVALHGMVYDSLPGFGIKFEALVARTLAEFIFDFDGNGRIWMAERNGELVGCAAIVLRDGPVGQLRWVVVDPSARGIGLGKELVSGTLRYCEEQACESVYLLTANGLPESQALYASLGFVETSRDLVDIWDGERPLLRMELPLT